jgi:hypothetical protein
VKGLWKKSDDFNKSLMIYRATPLESGFTPAELMFGRNIRTGLPQLGSEGKAPFKAKDLSLKQRQKRNFDRRTGARPLDDLEEGDRVWVKTNANDGAHGQIVGDSGEPDSYLVDREGILIRRNRKHLARLPSEEVLDEVTPAAQSPEGVVVESSPGGESSPGSAVDMDRRTVTRYGRVSRPNRKYLDYTK